MVISYECQPKIIEYAVKFKAFKFTLITSENLLFLNSVQLEWNIYLSKSSNTRCIQLNTCVSHGGTAWLL